MSARARRTRPLARRRQILICSYYTDHGPYCDKLGRLDEFDYRVGLEWKPTSFYHATFKLESIQRETGGYAYQPVPPGRPNGTVSGGDLPASAARHDL
ncbi:hypothetical protein [Phenylobacterium montanum]|uniref:Uncharacterized protein n=1 Tax=Phenylobacterium montanum TaxID=2823693 RepID=A0A975G0P8_9CAUL|nr:hypothetical protein [Caulobacter sp. S6]QUD88639.1 hypothetical protein KCG34_01760 [Caulobacter sp. S6]